jgi:hypothetical protein
VISRPLLDWRRARPKLYPFCGISWVRPHSERQRHAGGLVCDEQFANFLHTRKWKFSFRAQHRSVFCCHNYRPAISKPSLGALRCLWPGLACRIFTAHAQCSFPVGCLHGRGAWIFDQPLHSTPAIIAAKPGALFSRQGGYRGTRARGSGRGWQSTAAARTL